MRKFTQVIFWIALFVGVVGRFWGAWVNNESNDDHVQVVQRIIANEAIDHRDYCWECFQPPMFYKMHAGISKVIGTESRRALIQQMQLFNACFSLLSIWLIWLILIRFYGKSLLSKWAISFVLINPAMFSMGIQGTNDTPVILLGTFCMFHLLNYLKEARPKYLIFMGLAALLAALSKGSGLAVFLMFTTWLFVLTVYKRQWMTLLIPAISVIILTFFSHYAHNYKTYENKNPFTTNLNKAAPPPFFDDGLDFYARPGISSIWNSFFHFRIGNMLKEPFNINGGDIYPRHRTSFWSQMYGSFYDIQFLQHPYTWTSKHPDRLNMVRIIFVLGLFTIIPLFIGLLFSVPVWRTFADINTTLFRNFICMSLVLGMFAFNMKYAYDYRDFGCIKAVFMLPVFLPMLLLFISGWKWIKNTLIRKTGMAIFGVLMLLLLVNILFLLHKLTLICYGYITVG